MLVVGSILGGKDSDQKTTGQQVEENENKDTNERPEAEATDLSDNDEEESDTEAIEQEGASKSEKVDDSSWSSEQKNAYRAAKSYISIMAFSKQGLITQLSSEYGDNYPIEVAEFAVTQLEESGEVDWHAEAKEAAKSYLDFMGFSKKGLIEQLSSEYGEGFPVEIAETVVEQIEADGEVDWIAEAEEAAKNYLETMPFSKQELINQLSSEYGDGFTYEEAETAVNNVYE